MSTKLRMKLKFFLFGYKNLLTEALTLRQLMNGDEPLSEVRTCEFHERFKDARPYTSTTRILQDVIISLFI